MIGDVQPLSRLQVTCIAEENGNGKSGRSAEAVGSGWSSIKRMIGICGLPSKQHGKRFSTCLPSMRRPVSCRLCLGGGWPGILLHEAIGHGLEADFNRKKTSAFSNLLGKKSGFGCLYDCR